MDICWRTKAVCSRKQWRWKNLWKCKDKAFISPATQYLLSGSAPFCFRESASPLNSTRRVFGPSPHHHGSGADPFQLYSTCVCFQWLRLQCVATPSWLRRSGAQHSYSARSRQEARHRYNIKHGVHFQNKALRVDTPDHISLKFRNKMLLCTEQGLKSADRVLRGFDHAWFCSYREISPVLQLQLSGGAAL